MLSDYLERGALAGGVGGVVFGLFVWLVATPLVRVAETYEENGGGHEAAAVPDAVASVTSVLGGVVFGVLLGAAVFGLGYYLLEPSLPGGSDAGSYLLAAAGFVTVSGAPWVALPPQPPGVETALSTDVRLGVYVVMMGIGALACALAWQAYELRTEHPARAAGLGAAALAVVPVVGVLVPTGVVHSRVPAALAAGFRWVTVFGQVLLWLAIAGTHALLLRRSGGQDRTNAPEENGVAVAD